MFYQYLLSLFLLILSFSGFAQDNRVDWSGFIRAKLQLIDAREQILERSISNARNGWDDPVQQEAYRWSYDNASADRQRLQLERELYESYLSAYESGGVAGLLNVKADNDQENCRALGDCLNILSEMNKELVDTIIDANNILFFDGMNSINVGQRDEQITNELDLLLSEQFSLDFQRFACERGVATYNGHIDINPNQMASCLLQTHQTASREGGHEPVFQLDEEVIESFASPLGVNLRLEEERRDILESISEEVMARPDYTMTPWELFSLCSRHARGSLRGALNICYQVARYNRARPDFTRKYFDIRGDRSAGGDNSGDWYHVFGMAHTSVHAGGMASYFGQISEAIKSTFERNSDELEQRNNQRGREIGGYMRQNFEGFQASNQPCQFSQIFEIVPVQ